MTEISDEDINLAMQAGKISLFSEGISCIKKERNENFDVLIGCFDGAEALVVSYISQQLSHLFEHHSV